VAYANGSYEGSIASDENVIADLGLMLRYAVVIAGDGPGADVRIAPDRRVADVTQVRHLRAFMNNRLLNLYEPSYMCALANIRTGPQMRERPDLSFGPYAAGIENGMRADDGIVIHPCIAENAAGLNLAARADACFAEKLDARLD
jgi:hypothetical protein